MTADFNKLLAEGDLNKIVTSHGDARTMNRLDPEAVNTASEAAAAPPGSTGADWFGPRTPLPPLAPPEVAGRVADYTPGFNLSTGPRAFETVDFGTLRLLADAFDPVRLIIERRKDQITRLPWTIRPRHTRTSRRPKASDVSSGMRSRIADLTNFWRQPDYNVSFRQWLRTLLEDLLVIDAPSIYCERNGAGELIGLPIVDGALIKRVIDSQGRTPRPIKWTGVPFSWNGELITAQNYEKRGFKLFMDDLLYPPAYSLVLKGLPAVNYTTRDLIYRPLNTRPGRFYGQSPVEALMSTINIAMRRARHHGEYYRVGNMPEGIIGLPESWNPEQAQRFQDFWDNMFVGNLAKRRQVRFVVGDAKFTPFKEPALKAELDEWLIRIVCFAFSYPPAAFVSLSNRSIAEQHEKQAEEEGIDPLKQWVSTLINDIVEDEFGEPDLEFAWIEENEVDQGKQAEILSRLVETGILTANQARERLGEEPDPSPAANRLMVKTATGYVPLDANAIELDAEVQR